MADIGAANWNEDDASNNSAAPDGAPEGMAPSGVNNVLRAIMGAVKRWYDWSTPKVTGGSSTAYTLNYAVAPGELVEGMTHLVQFNATCGTAPTLSVNSLGAKPIHKYLGGAWVGCVAGDITPNMVARVAYNSGDGSYRITGASRNRLDVLTARGDLLTRDAADYARLPIGPAGKVLASDGTDVVWGGFSPGDIKWAFSSTEDPGWLFASGKTIGNATSGATARANADTEALFTKIWNESNNTDYPIQDGNGTPTTRGGSAAADFAANKRMPLPDLRDRFAVGKANMGGTDAARIAAFDTTVLGKAGGDSMHDHAACTITAAPPGLTPAMFRSLAVAGPHRPQSITTRCQTTTMCRRHWSSTHSLSSRRGCPMFASFLFVQGGLNSRGVAAQ
jgi:hypothetical protein